mmetsp:Transcript_15759/g.38861  ORF Transcript_15759/g.38861 Transcript_15759/m.38861 type:complete len:137 (+) Transcript_15759:94-504(+)|eukprot:CAMPEP_0114515022 /NCGR_PEP_ID=MMETSP0109-20121206/16484_1 /TAXON_ID=29199 /ORGANISM="Chlorarachnion reptans, Strain CCCM449" /LENGTH=136 /DNA_ID=CAMNT_0001695139 /DNA_START=81 /DNA_END=491 /DNA_ORIENTATION=-
MVNKDKKLDYGHHHKKPKSFGSTMKAMLARKAQIEEDLKNTEKQIFDLEEAYIADTGLYGNVIKGWEGYSSAKPKQTQNMRKAKIIDKDRIFSDSSTTAPKTDDDDPGADRGSHRRRERTSTRNKAYAYSDEDDFD